MKEKIRIAANIICIVTACWIGILLFISGSIFGPAPKTQLFRYVMFGFIFSAVICYGFDMTDKNRSVLRRIFIVLGVFFMLSYLFFFVALPVPK